MTHSVLIFHLFEEEWSLLQGIGTQQGATHSPVLFSYYVSDQYDVLTGEWDVAGEVAPFYAGHISVWGVWFVDDATCFFTCPAQYSRLMPTLIAKLAYMGLRLSVKKTCTLGLVSPRTLTCLPDVAHLLEAKFVGVKLVFSDGDAHQISDLLRRALVAYVTNKTLLAHPEVPRQKRLQMFTMLVTSALRWLLCVVAPTRTNLNRFRVAHVTLSCWMLRTAVHFSNPVLEGIVHSRHACKTWLQAFSEMWDVLHVRMVWEWAGHVFRRQGDGMLYQGVANFRSSHRLQGARGVRRGPQNIGHRKLLAFLDDQGLPHDAAHDRQLWGSYLPAWQLYCGHRIPAVRHNVLWVVGQQYLGNRWRDVQGTFTGQEIWVLVPGLQLRPCVSTLRRREGWLHYYLEEVSLQSLCEVISGELMSRTFYVRVLVHAALCGPLGRACPDSCGKLVQSCVVVEMSCCPPEWAERMMALL